MAEIYGVLDLKAGAVVRAVAGNRAAYRPVVSPLSPSPAPADVARALCGELGIRRLYVADLEALEGGAAQEGAIEALAVLGGVLGFDVLLDAGIASGEAAAGWLARGAAALAAPLESLPSPAALAEILDAAGPERVVFSLDLREGRPIARGAGWPAAPLDIGIEAFRLGARRLLLLDLAHVGTRRGPALAGLLGEFSTRSQGAELLSGGGVRGWEDVELLLRAGAAGILAATALHDGAITREHVARARSYGGPLS